MLPRHDRVIAHRRVEPADSLDYFPTPPWATRAPIVFFLGERGFDRLTVEDPCCGEGHMAYPLADFFGEVRASDIHPYGYGAVRDYFDRVAWADIEPPHWTFLNPPFGDKSLPFLLHALQRSRLGVAAFVRTTQTEGIGRYEQLFSRCRPALVLQFVERVPLHRGRWIPDGDTLTAYSWIVWRLDRAVRRTDFEWIPPIARSTLHYQRDLDALPWSTRPPKKAKPRFSRRRQRAGGSRRATFRLRAPGAACLPEAAE